MAKNLSVMDSFIQNIALMCGNDIPLGKLNEVKDKLSSAMKSKKKTDTFGYRQLNEILLLCNERIVSKEFFRFLVSGNGVGQDYISFGDFDKRVIEFRKLAMLQFGSFRFAFNYLCRRQNITEEFDHWLLGANELKSQFQNRQEQILTINAIKKENLYLLGYLTPDGIDKELVQSVRKQGQQNFETYLSWDYIDVYVATSMREPWEYIDVYDNCQLIFNDSKLKKLKVRYFDPTQNFHENSIAKSLIEGLMLKRAKCTLYFVQETDTMGKDSEMASTLAQGKPVIAYVPTINPSKRIRELKNVSINVLLSRAELLKKVIASNDLEKFRDIVNTLAKIVSKKEGNKITDNEFKRQIYKYKKEYEQLLQLVADAEKEFYDKRAETLRFNHPLRFQINLKTGVANGVLVTRTTKQCSLLIQKVLTNSLEFDILKPGERIDGDEEHPDKLNYRLVEKITRCAFRAVTKHELLTNSFWNLYKLGDR
ncbi:MAG: hypothetical protein R3F48_00975 [Candidatus Zixiibacteriota bacterium]